MSCESVSSENERQAERGKSGRQCPDDGERRRQHQCQQRDEDDAHERARDRSVHERQQVHAGRDDPHRAERPQQIDRVRRGERGQRGHHDVRVQDAAGIGSGEGGHLLQEDDDRDAEREAFDDRPRNERHSAPEARSAGDQHDDPGEHAHHGHRGHAVRGHDRGEHDDHRAGRPRHLDVRPAEHRSDDAGDDRRDQPGRCARTGGDAESEGERQRDDSDGEPRQQVPAPRRGRSIGSPGRWAEGRGRTRPCRVTRSDRARAETRHPPRVLRPRSRRAAANGGRS